MDGKICRASQSFRGIYLVIPCFHPAENLHSVKASVKKKKSNTVKNPVKKTKKKRRSRKPVFKDKITAVLISALLVAFALAASLLLVFLHTRARETLPLAGPVSPESGQEEAVEPSIPDGETIPEIIIPEPAPAEKKPPAQSQELPKQDAPKEAIPKETVPKERPIKINPVPEQVPVVTAAPERPPAPSLEKPGRGKLVFVIDDAGNNLQELEPFLRFPGPLTIAVLPGLPNSAEAARRIRAAGKEVFLHQPMESLGGHNPGPGAIYVKMEEAEIRAIINKNLDEIWPAAGINNHEGSRVTMDPGIMELVLNICRERGILFLDSRTTADTAAPATAQKLGIMIRERDVFLDNDQDRASISGYINTGLKRAEQRGSAIMIGHTWSPELAPLLEEQYSLWINEGYSLSTVTGISE